MAMPAKAAAKDEAVAAPIDAGVRIGHVHLKVADLDRALAFYCGVLGFQLMQRSGAQAAFISAGGYHHHIGLNTWESRGGAPRPQGTTGLYHLAILYPTRAALADALRRLIAADIPLDGASDHGVSEWLYLRRPRRERRRALLGPAARTMAAHRRRQAFDVHAPARSDGAARRVGRNAAAACRGRARHRPPRPVIASGTYSPSPGAAALIASA
jgi:catechol 2,3-dioxygenase